MKISESDLIDKIDDKRSKVRTNSFDISFNELVDMFRDEEIIIDPEYQRLFRWSEKQQSRFIESLVLELPLPPIFVIENTDGVYELIDGLQRVSSYLHYRGFLGDEKFKLVGCDIIKSLNNFSYEELPKVIQIRLKRNFVRMEVIRKESDSDLRYHMFKRLNRGGEILSEQEVRNCTVRILDNKFIDFIIKLSQNEDFINVTKKLSEEKRNMKEDQELVLRYFALKNNVNKYNSSLDEFLTEYMEDVTQGNIIFNYEDEERIFSKTFQILNQIQGEDIFSTVLESSKVVDNLVMYLYDSFTLGVSDIESRIEDTHIEGLKEKISNLKKKDELVGKEIYKKRTGSKGNTLRKREIVRKYLGEIL